MTTKRNPKKLNIMEISITFYETKWSKHSVTTNNQAQKIFESTKNNWDF